jgi:hypothetical protein
MSDADPSRLCRCSLSLRLSACLCSRLWGSHGQMNLETAHICCIGSGATASETLKNLVLPSTCRRIDAQLAASASSCSRTLRLLSLPHSLISGCLLISLLCVCCRRWSLHSDR